MNAKQVGKTILAGGEHHRSRPKNGRAASATTSIRNPTACLVATLLVILLALPAQAASPDDGFNPGANGIVRALAVQADGKIVVGGDFTTLGGDTRDHLGRLNPDGTFDATFNPGA